MHKILALVRQGRLHIVGPTSLPEGTIVELLAENDLKLEWTEQTQLLNFQLQRTIDEATARLASVHL